MSVRDQIESLIEAGKSNAEIVAELGTGERYVRRVRAGLQAGLPPSVEGAPVAPKAPKPRISVTATMGATVRPGIPAHVLAMGGLADLVLAAIKGKPATLEALAEKLNASADNIGAALEGLRGKGVRVHETAAGWGLDPRPMQPAWLNGAAQTFVSNDDNTFSFGACGDQHYGSKYCRPEVVEALYDVYQEQGIKTVFNTGNWIDGEARFNTYDLDVHGMDAQCRYLARHFPRREGITTYAVAGDDHEGWYSQREGVDIGRYAERAFQDEGRSDWVNLGYMEAPVRLVNAHTGKESILSVVHPGGGSSYALSYTMQKLIESLDGGEKPAVLLAGHYHKLWSGNVRNVWVMQTGTAQDQTPFMRKKKLEAHVGGGWLRLVQDPATGAIVRCQVELLRYFNRGYYQNRWSHSGPVNLLNRAP